MTRSEPDWLTWAREMQAMAQTGLTFTRDPYDRERYVHLRELAARIMSKHTGIDAARIEALFTGETGYATPKIDVRGAAFDDRGHILLVREVADGDRWTLPGGWADVNLTPAENVAKEICEESGYTVSVEKLAAAWDRTKQGHTPALFSCTKLFFVCRTTGGGPASSMETSEVGFFAEEDVPADLSLSRVLPHQIGRMFTHARDPSLPTEFE